MELKVKNLKYSFEDKNVLENVSFSLKGIEDITLVGSNGTGKSTLIKLLMGLLIPIEGTVKYNGKNIVNNNLFREEVGFIFQNPDDQFVLSIVEDELVFRMENFGIERKEMERRIVKVLNDMNMSEFRYKNISNLSGGQKQKLAIASQIILNKKLIILDEPTSMLDNKSAHEFNQSLKELNVSTLRISHNPEETFSSKRVLVLHSGKILVDTSPKEYFSNKKLLMKTNMTKSLEFIKREMK